MKLLATLGAFVFSGVVAATPLHNIVVFGDSLSDNGNLYEIMKHQLPQSPPYFEGRFSNGPVWVEHLAAAYFPHDTPGHFLDYAFGGAGVSEDEDDDTLLTLRKEVDTYLLSHQDKASSDSLFVVWIGANNYLAMPENVEETLKNVTEGIEHSIKLLADKGAKHIMIMNLPDLGHTPAAIEFDSVDSMTYFSTQHNATINQMIARFKTSYPDIDWIFFDLNKMFSHVLDNPQQYGFTHVNSSCVDAQLKGVARKSMLKIAAHAVAEKANDECEGYIFFDLVHPSASAHKIIAEKVKVALDELGLEFAE